MFVIKKKASAEDSLAQNKLLLWKAVGMVGYFGILRISAYLLAPRSSSK